MSNDRITTRTVGNVVLVSGPGDLPRDARMFPRDAWEQFLREVRSGMHSTAAQPRAVSGTGGDTR